MEILEKRTTKTIPYKPGVFQVNSIEEIGDTKSLSFKKELLNNKKVILIQSPWLEKDNFKVIHVGARITLIISEKKRLERPLYVHNLKIKDSDYNSYERLKSFDYCLPDNYYVHIDTKWNEHKKRVEVYFR